MFQKFTFSGTRSTKQEQKAFNQPCIVYQQPVQKELKAIIVSEIVTGKKKNPEKNPIRISHRIK